MKIALCTFTPWAARKDFSGPRLTRIWRAITLRARRRRLEAASSLFRKLSLHERVVLVAGLSCSGKSTQIEQFFSSERYLLVTSSDLQKRARAHLPRTGRETVVHWDLWEWRKDVSKGSAYKVAAGFLKSAQILEVFLIAPSQSELIRRTSRRYPSPTSDFLSRFADYKDPEFQASTVRRFLDELTSCSVSSIKIVTESGTMELTSLEAAKSYFGPLAEPNQGLRSS